MKEGMSVTGKLTFKFTNEKTGEVREFHETNRVVSLGKEWIAARFDDVGIPQKMTHMAIGDPVAPTDVDRTDLEQELDRNALQSTSVVGNQVVYMASWPAGDAIGDITEAGIFNGSIMLCRSVFGTKSKAAGDSLSITWTLTIN